MNAGLVKASIAGALSILLSSAALADDLSLGQKKELTVFGLRTMGMQAGIGDVKEVLSKPEIEQMVAAGINLNGHLCAQITDIRVLKIRSAYEVTCIIFRGGDAKKSYVVEALKGIASEI